jgi:hypothetical protein
MLVNIRAGLKTGFLFLLLALPALATEFEPVLAPLFHIERNKNANIVQYDVQLDQHGQLHAKEPLVAYWVRHANHGEIKQLTWVQKKFAYGFRVKLNRKDNSVKVDMAANISRSLSIERHGEDYFAVAEINGVVSFIDRIFIQASGKGISTKVEYIELFGSAVSNQKEQYERFTP